MNLSYFLFSLLANLGFNVAINTISTTPRSEKQISKLNESINAEPHLPFIKATIPPIMLKIIPKIKTKTKKLDKNV